MRSPSIDLWHNPARGDWALLAALPALALLWGQCVWLPHFVSDDAFISLRYVERLLDGHGLTWTDGERVEGYSNLLWILLVAALRSTVGFGIDVVFDARLLGFGCSALALVAIACAGRPSSLASSARAAVAPLLVASAQVALGWTQAGLEGPLVLLLLALGFGWLAAAWRREGDPLRWRARTLLGLGAPFALACWTRPDGPLWVAVAGLALAWSCRRAGWLVAARRAAWLGLPAIGAVAAQLAFRIAYYGDTVPNTAHVKAELDPARWPDGFAYVGKAIAAHPGSFAVAALAALALVRRAPWRGLALALLLPVVAWLLYLASVGGDHFPARRLLHGALAPLAVLVATAIAVDAKRALVAVAALLGAAANLYVARTDAQSHELRAETWEWQGREVGDALARAFGAERPLLAVDAAGAVPFYSRLPALDLLGLCDRTIATTPLPAWLDTVLPGTPKPPGHLRGNGGYVLDRAPDLFLFGPPPGRPLPVFASGAELEADPRFLDGCRLVRIDLGERLLVGELRAPITALLWVRVEGRVGVQRRDAQIDVPAWLFGSFRLRTPVVRRYQPQAPDAAAAVGAEVARLVPWLDDARSAAVPEARDAFAYERPLSLRLGAADAALDLALPAGRWRAEVDPADAGVTVAIDGLAADGDGTFRLAAAGERTLRLRANDGAAASRPVQRVRFVRVAD